MDPTIWKQYDPSPTTLKNSISLEYWSLIRFSCENLACVIDRLAETPTDKLDPLNSTIRILYVAWVTANVETVCEYDLLTVWEVTRQSGLKAHIYCSVLNCWDHWWVDKDFSRWELLVREAKVAHPYSLDKLRVKVASEYPDFVFGVL